MLITLKLPFSTLKQSMLSSPLSYASTDPTATNCPQNGIVRPLFTSFVFYLTLSAGSLPAADDLIWIILLVHYLPDLAPETSNDEIEYPWQTSENFKLDHDFARARAADLWSWVHARAHNGPNSWDQLTKDIKIDAWRAIEYYQHPDASPKVPKKIHISHVCLSPNHLHD